MVGISARIERQYDTLPVIIKISRKNGLGGEPLSVNLNIVGEWEYLDVLRFESEYLIASDVSIIRNANM